MSPALESLIEPGWEVVGFHAIGNDYHILARSGAALRVVRVHVKWLSGGKGEVADVSEVELATTESR